MLEPGRAFHSGIELREISRDLGEVERGEYAIVDEPRRLEAMDFGHGINDSAALPRCPIRTRRAVTCPQRESRRTHSEGTTR